jgi:hypothetical protein
MRVLCRIPLASQRSLRIFFFSAFLVVMSSTGPLVKIPAVADPRTSEGEEFFFIRLLRKHTKRGQLQRGAESCGAVAHPSTARHIPA